MHVHVFQKVKPSKNKDDTKFGHTCTTWTWEKEGYVPFYWHKFKKIGGNRLIETQDGQIDLKP